MGRVQARVWDEISQVIQSFGEETESGLEVAHLKCSDCGVGGEANRHGGVPNGAKCPGGVSRSKKPLSCQLPLFALGRGYGRLAKDVGGAGGAAKIGVRGEDAFVEGSAAE